MKYRPKIYAKALLEALAGLPPKKRVEAAENFLAIVRKNGDTPHLLKIINKAEELWREKNGIRKIVFEVARSPKKPLKEIFFDFVGASDIIFENIKPELVAGVRITIDDRLQFDNSFKGKLDKLFGFTRKR